MKDASKSEALSSKTSCGGCVAGEETCNDNTLSSTYMFAVMLYLLSE